MGLMTASPGRPRRIPENERNCPRLSPAGLFQAQVTSCREKNRTPYQQRSWKCWPPQNDKIPSSLGEERSTVWPTPFSLACVLSAFLSPLLAQPAQTSSETEAATPQY